MDYFLASVVDFLYRKHNKDFKNVKLVFPNRRTGVFLLEELKKKVTDESIWAPSVLTINDFISQYSNLSKANSTQLLIELYLCYRKLSKSFQNFDDFYQWGEVLLSDFNDIDKYKVDAESVFVNVKNFKSIESGFDFLTDDQKKVLERFFGSIDLEKPSALQNEFLLIWEIMYPLYIQLQKELLAKNIAYEGMVFKDALKKIQSLKIDDFDFDVVYFIGFNAITPIEEELFEVLKNIGVAQFCWDYDDYYVNNSTMEAGLFQRKYIKKFPPITLSKNSNQLKGKNINVISTPTNHGQVFNLNQVLSELNISDYSNTAVVLSDEKMLMPVVNHIPNKIADINVTMGYPVNDSLSGSFIDLLMQLCLNSRINKSNITSFYYKQVNGLLKHSFIQLFNKEFADGLLSKISAERLYNINEGELNGDDFVSLIFKGVDNVGDFINYLNSILSELQSRLITLQEVSSHLLLENEFLYRINEELNQLNAHIGNYALDLKLTTYFSLVKKVLKSLRVPFEGEPISGLQVMGFLETRNLDFENVIILSVNEGVIPVQDRAISFIPFGLRRGFGLPTSELNDAMYAYYFYRIIQAAKNVWLMYNSGSSGMVSGEKSRLLYQLEFDSNFTVSTSSEMQSIEVLSNKTISVKKEGEVWMRMQSFLDKSQPKLLSPSALSIYLQCPLWFYFRSVAKVREVSEIEETVDARLFGNIFHKAAEYVYAQLHEKKQLVTVQVLKGYLNNDALLDEIILKSFSEVFFGDGTKRKISIEGKNQLVFDVIKKYLMQLLKKDADYAPFSIVGLEHDISSKVNFLLNGEMESALVGGQIDRLDRTDNSLRIIDYKTGGDKLLFDDLEDVFSKEKIKDTKAVFQTFVYSYLIKQEMPDEQSITPMVYQVKKMFEKQQAFEITTKKYQPFLSGNFVDINEVVGEKLRLLLSEIFDKNEPFYQTNNLSVCEYCPHKQKCGR